jgi:uncharacterized protein
VAVRRALGIAEALHTGRPRRLGSPPYASARMPTWLPTVLLLILSNIFMTFAWYYHLSKKEAWPLLLAISLSWMIALPEYMLQVPANRLGHHNFGGPFSAPQLKVIQEAITLAVFIIFTILVLKERPRMQDGIAFLLIFAAVAVAMSGRR